MEGTIFAEFSNPEIKLTSEEFSIGRSLKCSYVVDDLNVSRQHCEFQFNDNKWFIMDQSTNGTFLNNQLLDKGRKYVLKEGDVISLNDRCTYIFKMRNKKSNTTTSKNALSEDEITDISETVTECAAGLNQKLNIAFLEETVMAFSSTTSQGERRKKRKSKWKLKNDENMVSVKQNFNIAFLGETAMACSSTLQDEKRKKRKSKQKLKNDENTEESEDAGTPKKR